MCSILFYFLFFGFVLTLRSTVIPTACARRFNSSALEIGHTMTSIDWNMHKSSNMNEMNWKLEGKK